MLSFAIGRVCQGDCLLSLIRSNSEYESRTREPAFWGELYAFAIFPVDLALSYYVAPDLMNVRRATSRAAYVMLSEAFAQANDIWITESEWSSMLHDRLSLYGGAIGEFNLAAFQSLGMISCWFILGRADPAVSILASDSFFHSHRVLPSLIDGYEVR